MRRAIQRDLILVDLYGLGKLPLMEERVSQMEIGRHRACEFARVVFVHAKSVA